MRRRCTYDEQRNDCGQYFPDSGGRPFVFDIHEATLQNNFFRRAVWTGTHLQVTLMCIGPRQDIGLECHAHLDQFLRIEQGQGVVMMGSNKCALDFQRRFGEGCAILIPAGTWHNVVNTGRQPLKLYSIYAPPAHPRGTIHRTKEEAMAAENHY